MASLEPRLDPDRVIFLGVALILFGMTGFYLLPGMIAHDASGSKIVNAFYCSVITLTTVGFGDICPVHPGVLGRMFCSLLAFGGIGFFVGPILNLASSWKDRVPGGLTLLGSLTLSLGVVIFTTIEGMSLSEAVELSVVTGTTIGYGNLIPSTNLGKIATALYAILVCNVIGVLLQPGRTYLEKFCERRARPRTEKTNSYRDL
jgi:hypothetical protein